jgi:hypothetical protein
MSKLSFEDLCLRLQCEAETLICSTASKEAHGGQLNLVQKTASGSKLEQASTIDRDAIRIHVLAHKQNGLTELHGQADWAMVLQEVAQIPWMRGYKLVCAM